MIIRPSMKIIAAIYVVAVIVAAGGAAAWLAMLPDKPSWPAALPALALIWPLKHHLRRHLTKLTIEGDKLHYETGLLAKTTRIMELVKVQDVRVDQTVGQRLIRTGNLSIETAGETSRITIEGINRPSETAHTILDLARRPTARGTPDEQRKT